MISICPRQPDNNNNNNSTRLSINTNQPPATPLATNPLCEGQYLQFDKEERKIETHTHILTKILRTLHTRVQFKTTNPASPKATHTPTHTLTPIPPVPPVLVFVMCERTCANCVIVQQLCECVSVCVLARPHAASSTCQHNFVLFVVNRR